MDTESLLSIKKLPECNLFNEVYLNDIKNYFKESNIKYVKKNKKVCNVLKNSNFNLKKNKISNKLIFILNKLSETNLDKILIEFINNIKIENLESYEIIQKIIFDKIIKDNKFIDIYCEFLINIIKYIYNKYNYKPDGLINITNKFVNEYNSKNESDRLVFLNFLTIMIKNDFYTEHLINEISSMLVKLQLVQDLKFWFDHYSLDKQCLKGFKITNTREKLIYESIFEKQKPINNKKKGNEQSKTKINNSNIFLTQCDNIIEEYNYLNLNEEIDFFIENECKTEDNKYFFIEYIVNLYLTKKKIIYLIYINIL